MYDRGRAFAGQTGKVAAADIPIVEAAVELNGLIGGDPGHGIAVEDRAVGSACGRPARAGNGIDGDNAAAGTSAIAGISAVVDGDRLGVVNGIHRYLRNAGGLAGQHIVDVVEGGIDLGRKTDLVIGLDVQGGIEFGVIRAVE